MSSWLPVCEVFEMGLEGFACSSIPALLDPLHIQDLSKTQLVHEASGSNPTPGSISLLPHCLYSGFLKL